MVKKITLILVLAVGTFATDGCRHNVSMNPKVVQAVNANDTSKAVKTLSDALLAAHNTLEGLQTQEPDYYAKVNPWLVKLAKANDVAANSTLAYQQGNLSFDKVLPSLQNIALIGQELDPTTFGFKNPDTQQKVDLGFKLLQATIASVIQQFGTGK